MTAGYAIDASSVRTIFAFTLTKFAMRLLLPSRRMGVGVRVRVRRLMRIPGQGRNLWMCLAVCGLVVTGCANPWSRLPDNDTTGALRKTFHQPGRMLHGNYCGFGTIDGTLRALPIDALDVACQAHDICYIEGRHHCECDSELRQTVTALIDNPYTSDQLRRRAVVVRSTFSLPVCKVFPHGLMPPRDKSLLEEVNTGVEDEQQ